MPTRHASRKLRGKGPKEGAISRNLSFKTSVARTALRMLGPDVTAFLVKPPQNALLPPSFKKKFWVTFHNVKKPEHVVRQELLSLIVDAENFLRKELRKSNDHEKTKEIKSGLDYLHTLVQGLESPRQIKKAA